MLDKLASFYEAEVDNMVDNLTTLMEPLIMAVLGVLVGVDYCNVLAHLPVGWGYRIVLCLITWPAMCWPLFCL